MQWFTPLRLDLVNVSSRQENGAGELTANTSLSVNEWQAGGVLKSRGAAAMDKYSCADETNGVTINPTNPALWNQEKER
jgi:hypothetical protein